MDRPYQSVDILGVRIDKVTMDRAVDLVENWINSKDRHYIVTPNVEFIMAAQKDQEFKRILNEADLAIPDSARLPWANFELKEKNWLKKLLFWPFFLFPKLLPIQFDIITGVGLAERLCQLSSKKGFTVGFLGGKNSIAKKAADCLQKKYPGLKVVMAEDGPRVNGDGEIIGAPLWGAPARATPRIDILFVGFGQVKQEKWIVHNLNHLPVKVAMGVGGTFDELGGKVSSPPHWVEEWGFKWLFRLIQEPRRIKRQLVLIKFVWKILLNNMIQ